MSVMVCPSLVICCRPDMATTLLRVFILEDCTPFERTLLFEALADWEAHVQPVKQHLTFNRFDFTFDSESGTILIEDILDAGENGSEMVSPDELRGSLGDPHIESRAKPRR